jgi:hypothetical protein
MAPAMRLLSVPTRELFPHTVEPLLVFLEGADA